MLSQGSEGTGDGGLLQEMSASSALRRMMLGLSSGRELLIYGQQGKS